MRPPVHIILGPTASGKSAVAMELARRLGAEIISVDSMKVYRGMDLGTAKPTPEERRRFGYHLVDLYDPWENSDAKSFLDLCEAKIAELHAAGVPVVCEGGTALYLKGLVEGFFEGPSADEPFRAALRRRAAEEGTAALHQELRVVDPEAADRIHPQDLKRLERALEVYHLTGQPISRLQRQWGTMRPDFTFRIAGLRLEREHLYQRINARVRTMVRAGWLEECRRLRKLPRGLSPTAQQALGYLVFFAHLEGRHTLEQAVTLVQRDTRRFARKQLSWFRHFPAVTWYDLDADRTPEETAERILRDWAGGHEQAGH